jgi:hypothetical protein
MSLIRAGADSTSPEIQGVLTRQQPLLGHSQEQRQLGIRPGRPEMIDTNDGAALTSDHLHGHRTGRRPDPAHEPRDHPATLPPHEPID